MSSHPQSERATEGPGDARKRPSRLIEKISESLAALNAEHPGRGDRDEARRALDTALGEALDGIMSHNGDQMEADILLGRCEKVAALSKLRRDLDAEERADAENTMGGVHAALVHLRGVDDLEQLVAKALTELCRNCGFDRVIFSRIHDNHLIAEAVHFEGDPTSAELILQAWRQNPPELTHLLLETELMRRRAPALVADAADDPRTFKPLVEAIGTSSYVAAPLLPSSRVVGFLHADRGIAGDAVDQADCDALTMFAEGFGYAAERTVLLDRLRFQRRHLRQQMMAADALASEFASDLIELASVGSIPELDLGLFVESAQGSSPHRLEKLLTKRELDVLTLMSAGATNAQIADRLVLAEGTVKTHVKHVLRKLRASNRAEAVARYMRLSSQSRG